MADLLRSSAYPTSPTPPWTGDLALQAIRAAGASSRSCRRLQAGRPQPLVPISSQIRGESRIAKRPRCSGRRSLGINGSKILLPDIVHGAVHGTHGELTQVQQQTVAPAASRSQDRAKPGLYRPQARAASGHDMGRRARSAPP
jgi:hypothetical protein